MSRPSWRRRLDRRLWWSGLLVALVAAGFYVLFTRPSIDEDEPSTTSGREEFTVEGEGGTLVFGQDDEGATLDFEGEEAGSFSFDLNGDGVVTEGESGSFELTGGPPPGWPAELPVPSGALPVRGSVVRAGPLSQLSATYEVPLSPEEAVIFYTENLADLVPIVESGPDGAALGTTISFEGIWTGFVSVEQVDGATQVAIQLVIEPDSAG